MGSSPLTRGKRGFAGLTGPIGRLIPAHAGKTRDSGWRELPDGAHPRSRGENALDSRRWSWEKGSSPLTRGKRSSGCTSPGEHRLIPAHAGKTQSRAKRRSYSAAHPRSRGENRSEKPPGQLFVGSSPLTRGKRISGLDNLGQIRLIPAHAGKTPSTLTPPTWTTAHPRSRGENLGSRGARPWGGGSSPLTRGKLCFIGGKLRCRRLIPAHAGKTVMGRFWRNHAEAHPRSRGENAAISATVARQRGSSPLTRGKLAYRVKTFAQLRLIPAHAGKTCRLRPGGR